MTKEATFGEAIDVFTTSAPGFTTVDLSFKVPDTFVFVPEPFFFTITDLDAGFRNRAERREHAAKRRRKR